MESRKWDFPSMRKSVELSSVKPFTRFAFAVNIQNLFQLLYLSIFQGPDYPSTVASWQKSADPFRHFRRSSKDFWTKRWRKWGSETVATFPWLVHLLTWKSCIIHVLSHDFLRFEFEPNSGEKALTISGHRRFTSRKNPYKKLAQLFSDSYGALSKSTPLELASRIVVVVTTFSPLSDA